MTEPTDADTGDAVSSGAGTDDFAGLRGLRRRSGRNKRERSR